MSDISLEQVNAGQAIYTKLTLPVYDLLVLGFSNRFVWKCPTQRLLKHYQLNLSANHLDVGVGTGYFLHHARYPSRTPRIALMDLNEHSLDYAANRISRYSPEVYQRNVLEPVSYQGERFDSLGLNYLLHCLPGDIRRKAVLFDHLKPLLNPGAQVFGATLLQGDVPRSPLAQRLMAVYNAKGIFCNEADTLPALRHELERRFKNVSIELVGCAALFSAQVR